MKRIIAFLLVLATLVTFVSCSKKEKKNNEPQKVKLEHVYLSEKIALPEEDYISSIIFSGDKSYVFATTEMTDAETGEYYSLERIMLAENDFKNFTEFYSFKSEYTYDEETGENTYSNLNGCYPDNQGGIWVAVSSGFSRPTDSTFSEWESGNDIEFIHYSSDGIYTETVNLRDLLTALPIEGDFEYVYVSHMTQGKNGNKYYAVNDNYGKAYILATDSGNNYLSHAALNETMGLYDKFSVLENGNLRAAVYDWSQSDGEAKVIEYNVASGEMKTIVSRDSNDSMIVAGDGTVYVNDRYVVSKVDVETGDLIPMLDWINSDVNSDNISNIFFSGHDIYSFEWNSNWTERFLLHMTPANDGDVVEKYVMTLAASDISSNLKQMVIDYNRKTQDYKIQVKAYGWQDEGMERFDQDLLSGKIPDIVFVEDLNFDKYAKKNFFADLGAMLDTDMEISRSDFLENVLSAMETSGKLYRMPVSFSLRSIIGKTAIVGESGKWTWDDFLSLQQGYPNSKMIGEIDQASMFDSMLPVIIEDFIDYDSGKVNFTDGTFAKFLEFIKTLPKEIDWDTYYADIDWEEYDKRYANDEELLMTIYLSGFMNDYYSVTLFGEPVSLKGYPTPSQSGEAIDVSAQFAIGEKSVYKKQAWDFMKMLLTEDYQTEYTWQFPVLKSVFDKKQQEAIDEVNNTQSNGVDIDGDGIIDDEYSLTPNELEKDVLVESSDIMLPVAPPESGWDGDSLSQKEFKLKFIDDVSRSATTVNKLVRSNDPAIEIIKTEAAAYLDGQKSLEETCRIIESRVSMYLGENM